MKTTEGEVRVNIHSCNHIYHVLIDIYQYKKAMIVYYNIISFKSCDLSIYDDKKEYLPSIKMTFIKMQ